MAEEGLVARTSRRKRRHGPCQGEISKAPANLVRRDFSAGLPDFPWPADVTELPVPAGKACPGPIVDCLGGRVVSRSASTSPDAETANSSPGAACAQLKGGERPWIHPDRGCHCRRPGWVAICEENGPARSMSAKGRGPDDSACEGLFGRTRVEMSCGRDWSGVTIGELVDRLADYIEWHDEERIKMSLGGMSPNRYRSSMGLAA